MKCAEIETALIDFIDNKLDKTERGEIENHLATCERCLDMVRDYKHLFNTMETSESEQPDESLRKNFDHMLEGEKNKLMIEKTRLSLLRPTRFGYSRIMTIAAGIALLLAGAFTGILIKSNMNSAADKQELSELKTEVQDMKEIVMLNMLKEESPSQRLQAVSYSEELRSPDAKILKALISTLNQDKNVNVRLAAAYSLAKYASQQSVRDSLVASLSAQTEPIIQVVLMNILVEQKESNAIQPMQNIIANEKTLKEVKDVAQNGLKVLL